MSLILKLTLFATLSFSSKQLLTKLVGAVADHTITSNEVSYNHVIDEILFEPNGAKIIDQDSLEFSNALDRLLIEIIVYNESQTFSVGQVNSDEIRESLHKLKSGISKKPALKSYFANIALDDSKLENLVERKLRANRFIKYKSNSSFIQVTDSEALEYFNKNRKKFGGSDFEQFKSNIKAFLSRQNAEARLRDWFDILRKKYKVKNLLESKGA